MRRFYAPERFVEITGPRGTIVVVDTRGFHKGKPLDAGDRLILQMEYADSLFGTDTTRPPLFLAPGSSLEAFAHKYPRLFAKFRLTPKGMA